jgi:predicted dehydrogenase
VNTEDYGSVLVHFEDNIQGVFTVSQVSAGRKNKLFFEIAADNGSLSWNQEEPNQLWVGKRDEANRILTTDPSLLSAEAANMVHYPGGHPEGWPDAVKNMFSSFYSSIVEPKQADRIMERGFATIQEGHRMMEIIEAIMKSHHLKQWVSINNL